MTILDFAKVISRLTGTPAPIQFVSPKDERTKDDPHIRQPDISRAEKLLGWKPVVPLEEGLTRTIDYFRELLSGGAK
jgi:dTDP-glucose 4,6-dehydratase